MAIRWDALLAREVARELDRALHRARLRAIRFDGKARDATLYLREATVVWRLHPERGTVELRDPAEPPPDALPLAMRVRRVHAPADERMVVFELIPVRGRRQASDLVVELLGNQWNCLVAEGEQRTLRHVLATREGQRTLRVGQPYAPPAPSSRAGADPMAPADESVWAEVFAESDPAERRRALISRIAWTSPLNADALVAEADAARALRVWSAWVDDDAPHPVVLQLPRGPQPYPLALPDVPTRPADSLLDAFAELTADDGADADVAPLDPGLLRRLERALASAERRHTALVAQQDRIEDPARLRTTGDILLARYHEIPSGSERATLTDFEGGTVEVELDPAAPAHKNAAAYYDRAAKAERALERLPGMIAEASERVDDLATLAARARTGDAASDEIVAGLPAETVTVDASGTEETLPYRRYTSSGGLEIRVGRGAKRNDELTFKHSSPNDVWLHARHAAGAHVVLRWAGPGNPPARDLEEAAVLAALYSKARTSGSVPVDYTLRKYVRKPRKAPAGSVVPDRVKTVFVTPDEALEERLAER